MSETSDNSKGKRRIAVVLSADICGYSAIAEQNDDDAVAAVLAFNAALSKACQHFNGRIFHKAGDGFLAEFNSAHDGLRAAVLFQRNLQDGSQHDSLQQPVTARVGVHVDDVYEQDDGDLLGHGVNVAARLQAAAAEGEILVSQQAISLLREKLDVKLHKRGALSLRNIDEPVIAFAIDITSGAGISSIAASVKAARRFARRYIWRALPVVFALLLIAVMLDSFLQRQENKRLTADNSAREQALQAEVDALANAIGEAQPFASQSQVIAVRAVAESLAKSDNPIKKLAVEMIEAGRISEAAAMLASLSDEEGNQNQPLEVRRVTLQEIGALTYYSDKERAIDAYSKLVELSAGADYQAQVRLGQLYLESSQADRAYAAFQIALQNQDDPRISTQATIGIGRFHLRRAQIGEAKKFLLQALAMSEQHRLPVEKSRSLLFLRATAVSDSDYELGERYLREALMIEFAMPPNLYNEHRIAELYYNLGSVLSSAERYDEAMDTLQKAIAISERINDRRTIVRALYNLGITQSLIEQPADAKKTLNRALEFAGTEKMDNIRMRTYWALADIEQVAGNDIGYCEIIGQARKFYTQTPDSFAEFYAEEFRKARC